MRSFPEVLTNNQSKNMNKTSDEIRKKLKIFNYNKTKRITDVATISTKSKKKKLRGHLQFWLTPETPLEPMPV